MRLLQRLYNDPKTGFIGPQKLYEKARLIDSSITLKAVRDWYASQSSIQQHQEKRSRFGNFKIASSDPNSWQADLTFYEGSTIFAAVNINSRMGYAELLPNKRGPTVLAAIKRLCRKHAVTVITTDNGTEFTNDKTEAFFQASNIEHYNNEPGDHHTMGKIERFNRTLKQRLIRIRKPLTAKILRDVIDNYNTTEHSAIHATPKQMEGKVIRSENDYNSQLVGELSNVFQLNDHVRYRLKPKTFEKESVKWSKTVYRIDALDGYRLKISSANNHVLYKSPNDLKIVDAPVSTAKEEKNQIWEVERILDHERLKNGRYRYLVKWKGYEEPTLEPQANLRLINKNRRSELENEYWKRN